MTLFPIFLKLQGEPVLVVGAGTLAKPKIEALVRAGANLCVVAPRAHDEIAMWQRDYGVRWLARPFGPGDVPGNRLVFAATGIQDIDRAVADECRRQGVFCNAIDDPPYCDFYSPAVVQRGCLQIAISTNGQSPALAQQIRQRLEQQFDESWAGRMEELGKQREQIRASLPPGEERNRLLHRIASDALASDAAGAGSVRTLHGRFLRLRDAVVRWLDKEDDKVALI